MRRLNVDESRVRNKNLVNFGMDYLIAEKSKVKCELKRYDQEFFEIFHRIPNRTEKELMRPLYMYYKNLKNSIDNKRSHGSAGNSHNNSSSLGSMGANSGHNSSVGSLNKDNNVGNSSGGNNVFTNNFTTGSKTKKEKEASVATNATGATSNIYCFNNIYNKNEKTDDLIVIKPEVTISKPEVIASKPEINTSSSKQEAANAKRTYGNQVVSNNSSTVNSNISYKKNDKIKESIKETTKESLIKETKDFMKDPLKETSSSSNKELKEHKEEDLFALLNDNTQTKKTFNFKDKKFTKTELIAIDKEGEELKREQIDLKQKLHNYQKTFYELHNRRVKYYKDIIDVQHEYQKYKENKIRIREIESILNHYKK